MFFRKWSNWEHVDFVRDIEDRTTELLMRHNDKGLTQYKHVHVGKYMGALGLILEAWKKRKALMKMTEAPMVPLKDIKNDLTIPF